MIEAFGDTEDGRSGIWAFPDGTLVTMTVPKTEPPITVKHAVYCLSSIVHQIHQAMGSEHQVYGRG